MSADERDEALALLQRLHRATELGWAGPARRPPPPVVPVELAAAPAGWRPGSRKDFTAPKPEAPVLVQSLREAYGPREGSRSVPSAGSIYQLRFFLLPSEGGALLTLDPASFELTASRELLSGEEIRAAFFQQVTTPAWLLVLAGQAEVYATRYGPRALRYLLLEAGHVAQELLRQFAAAGLVSCPLGAFHDEAVRALTGQTLTSCVPLYTLAVGRGA